VSRLRRALVALLVTSTAVFAVAVRAEHAEQGREVRAANGDVEPGGNRGEAAGTHSERETESHSEGGAAETHEDDERLLGLDAESTPLIALAIVGESPSQP
jgi:hypothetical protein